MREEYSDRKLFLGMALSPQNSASPSSATNAMTWLLRSIDHSLSAREARSAWADGTMPEPGSLAACAHASIAIKPHQIGDEKEQSACPGGEFTRGEHEIADIGDGLYVGADPARTLLVEPARQWRKALGGEHFTHRG